MGRAPVLTLFGALVALAGYSAGGCVFGGRSDLSATEDLRCWPNAADCNADAEDGCETDLLSSVEHCGACDQSCRSGLVCGGGECLAPNDMVEIQGYNGGVVVRTADGDVWAWGINTDHRITSAPGVPVTYDTEEISLPTRVEGFPPQAAQVATNQAGICARIGGDVWCRGSSPITLSRAGDSEFAHRIPGIRDAVHLEAGHEGFCAVDAFNRPLCWGSNLDWNMLAVGAGWDVPAPSFAPVELTQLPEGLRVVKPSLALTAEGRVLTWGSTIDDGFPGTGREKAPIREVPGLGKVRRVDRLNTAGYCVETEDLRVVCWGVGPTVWDPTFDANGHFVLSTGRRFRRVVTSNGDDFCLLGEDGELECPRFPSVNRGGVMDVANGASSQCVITLETRRVLCRGNVFGVEGTGDSWIEAPIPRDE